VTTRQVALLRGVNNIGMASRVAMADLRALFERLGFPEVRTVLNSGNVVFSVPDSRRGDVAGHIRRGLASRLGLASPVTMLSRAEVVAAVRGNPLADLAVNPSWLLVVVPHDPSDRNRLRPLLEGRWAPEGWRSAGASPTSGAREASQPAGCGRRSTARSVDPARPGTWPR
jgi:uncharacterized protein (DUF1697 family)